MSHSDVIGVVEKRIKVLARWLNKQKPPDPQMQSEWTKLLNAYNRLLTDSNNDSDPTILPNAFDPALNRSSLFGDLGDWRKNGVTPEKPKLFIAPDAED